MLLALGRWQCVAVSLPLTAAPEPVVFEIQQAIHDGELEDAVLASVVSLVDLATFEEDLLGDALLDERGLAFGGYDRRSVGEAAAAQVEFADDVVTVDPGSATAGTLLAHLVAPTSRLHVGWDTVPAAQLAAARHDTEAARRRVDPLQGSAQPCLRRAQHLDGAASRRTAPASRPAPAARRGARLRTGPCQRALLARVPPRRGLRLGRQRRPARHRQVGPWRHRRPGTRIVVTGQHLEDRRRIMGTFPRVLTTLQDVPASRARHLVDDGFAPWLGPIEN